MVDAVCCKQTEKIGVLQKPYNHSVNYFYRQPRENRQQDIIFQKNNHLEIFGRLVKDWHQSCFNSGNDAININLNQQVIIMENFDYAVDTSSTFQSSDYDYNEDIPEPIDQWSVEDFEQFASLIVDFE